MSSIFNMNHKDIDYNQSIENLSSPNPYIPFQTSSYVHKEDSFFPDENENINKNNHSLPNSKDKTTKIESKIKLKKGNKIIKKKKGLFIDINNNEDEKPLNIINLDKNKTKKKKEEKTEKKFGRKRLRNLDNNNNNTGEHNKFSDDNIRRKCKHLLLKYLLKFINQQIKIIYNGKIGNSIFKKELKIINQKQKSDASIRFNKLFLYKRICDIFSEDISKKYTNLPPTHNKIIINKLMNEEDEYKKIYFGQLFNLKFIQCLNHFIGKVYIPLLDGLKYFSEIKNDIIEKYKEDGEEYSQALEFYLNNFEDITNNKRARKLRK